MKILNKPYIFWIIGIFAVYILLNILLSGFFKTLILIMQYASGINWMKLSISIILTIIIGVLVAINSVLAYLRYKEKRQCREATTVATIGTLGGLVTGVCPLCVSGFFPLIFSALGISSSLASLPFGGIEIQLLVVAILALNLFLLKKKIYKRYVFSLFMNKVLVTFAVVLGVLLIGGVIWMINEASINADVLSNDEPNINSNSINKVNENPSEKKISEVKEITLTDQRFEYSPNVIRVKQGETVKITLNNIDAGHGIFVPDFNARGIESVTFTADKKGTFTFYCPTYCGSGHKEMKGTLIVE